MRRLDVRAEPERARRLLPDGALTVAACFVCGTSLGDGVVGVCAHHMVTWPPMLDATKMTDWAKVNALMCGALHRGQWPEPAPPGHPDHVTLESLETIGVCVVRAPEPVIEEGRVQPEPEILDFG